MARRCRGTASLPAAANFLPPAALVLGAASNPSVAGLGRQAFFRPRLTSRPPLLVPAGAESCRTAAPTPDFFCEGMPPLRPARRSASRARGKARFCARGTFSSHASDAPLGVAASWPANSTRPPVTKRPRGAWRTLPARTSTGTAVRAGLAGASSGGARRSAARMMRTRALEGRWVAALLDFFESTTARDPQDLTASHRIAGRDHLLTVQKAERARAFREKDLESQRDFPALRRVRTDGECRCMACVTASLPVENFRPLFANKRLAKQFETRPWPPPSKSRSMALTALTAAHH